MNGKGGATGGTIMYNSPQVIAGFIAGLCWFCQRLNCIPPNAVLKSDQNESVIKSIMERQKLLRTENASITSNNAQIKLLFNSAFYDTKYDTKLNTIKENHVKSQCFFIQNMAFLVRSQSVAPIRQKRKDAFLQAFFCFSCP